MIKFYDEWFSNFNLPISSTNYYENFIIKLMGLNVLSILFLCSKLAPSGGNQWHFKCKQKTLEQL